MRQIVNTSGRYPLGRAVLVQATNKPLSTIIDVPDNVKDRFAMLETEVRIIELGPHCWPGEQARAAVGDVVLITKFGGILLSGEDGKQYRMVNDQDIYCRCDEATEEKASAS